MVRSLSGPERHSVAKDLEKRGHVAIPNFLRPEIAEAIAARLAEYSDWMRTFRDIDSSGVDRGVQDVGLSDVELVSNAAAAYNKHGFSYLYSSRPICSKIKEYYTKDDVLRSAANILRGEEFLRLVNGVLGQSVVSSASVMATRYERGDFLTQHRDTGDGFRRLAFVVSLTDGWHADWGGELAMRNPDGTTVHSYRPTFNTVCLFKVPQDHAVSCVTPLAMHPRFSLTGWLYSE